MQQPQTGPQSPASPSAHDGPVHSPSASKPSMSRYGATSISPDQPVALTSAGTPVLNPRSCVTCRRRKVRCDKQMPCSNCRRAQIQCVFPAPGRAPRRPRPKDPNAPPKGSSEREIELLKRLRKLEGIVEDLSGQLEVESGSGGRPSAVASPEAFGSGGGGGGSGGGAGADTHPPRTTSAAGSPASTAGGSNTVAGLREVVASSRAESESDNRRASEKPTSSIQKQFGRLVLSDKGTASRYVSSAFWSKLNDELDAIRNEMNDHTDDGGGDTADEMGTPESSPYGSNEASNDHHGFMFGFQSVDVDLRTFHPLPSQIPFLWQVYQENVESLVKMLHVPSMDRLFRGMRKSIDNLSPGNEALVFAIYYAAIISMEEDEVQTNFASPKSELLARYRFALEQALAKANFLTTSDMAVLQAFTLFLTVVRRQDDTRFCWTLTGLAIRIAQALGIHRDGVDLGLPPFEVEMRRRLWWSICSLDLRGAEELGTELTIAPRSFDTELPSNIDDIDISPSSIEFPISRDGQTDTAISLVRYEICALARRLYAYSADMGPVGIEELAESLEERERMLVEVYDRVEERFLKNCFSNKDPLFWVAALVSRVIMAKIGLVIYQPVIFPGPGPSPELSSDIRDRLFVSTIQIVEYNHILNIDPRCRQWRWLFQSYRQWHAIAYMLMEVSRRPWSATCERAWEAAGILDYNTHPMGSERSAEHTAVWLPLKKLYLKTKKHRHAEVLRLRADSAAAHALDVQDRMNPLPERLGPVPGMESMVSELRARWKRLVQLSDDPYRLPPLQNRIDPGRGVSMSVASPLSPVHHEDEAQQRQVPGAEPGIADMQFMDHLMSRDFNPNEAWHYVAGADKAPEGLYPPGGAGMSGFTPLAATTVASPAISNSNIGDTRAASGVSGPSDQMLGQHHPASVQMQQGPQQGHETEDNQSSWMWTDPFSTMDPNFDVMNPNEFDVSMDIEEEINWQTWQENLKDLTKPAASNQPPTGRWGGL